MKNIKIIFPVLILFNLALLSNGQTFSKEEFIHPPVHFWPKPLWFWNNTTVTEEVVIEQIEAFYDKCGYGGFGIVPFMKKFRPEYLSDEYFRLYGRVLAKAKELGMTVSLYDEYGFPSGSVGAFTEGDGIPRFQLKYPQQTLKRLDKTEIETEGPIVFETNIPDGKLMGVVAMEINSLKRIDLTKKVTSGKLKCNIPEGIWKIMIFHCVDAGEPIADYLSPDAVKNFITMTHEAYYKRFKEYFGSVISGSFFDEPSMFHAKYRMWTDDYNEKFKAKYGFSPVLIYPALWYNIGNETQAARNYLFGFRADLYSEGFTKQVNDWSSVHGITATGHTAPEEVLNPVNSSGDLMKSFKYLEIPGIDKIGGNRPAERFYKVISSSAYNWDRPLVMSETYGAMPNYDKPGDLTWSEIFSIAMDQYAKGINMLIPHAVWYDNKQVTYRPELSYRNPLYSDSLKFFTQFLGRLNVMLQNDGRHIADIAVLYPIHSMLGEHYFDGPPGPSDEYFKGDIALTKIDYIDVANWLTENAGKDYTFLHPEILDEKCQVSDGKLHLNNLRNSEDYQVIIIPGCKSISVSNLQKIVLFYKKGGMVIFTSTLPYKSSEIGKDHIVTRMIESIFPQTENPDMKSNSNSNGGRVIFIEHPNGEIIRKVLADSELRFDVNYSCDENIRYIHKVMGNNEIFYFANLGNRDVNMSVSLRGKLILENFDPHSAEIKQLSTDFYNEEQPANSETHARLILKPYHSCFWVGVRIGI